MSYYDEIYGQEICSIPENEKDEKEIRKLSNNLLKIFLKDVGKYPRLTSKEESDIGKIIEKAKRKEDRWVKKISQLDFEGGTASSGLSEMLSSIKIVRSLKKLDGQKDKFFQLIKKSDSAKLEEYWSSLLEVKSEINKSAKTLFVSHLRLVIYMAKRYKGYGLDLLDLIQEGSIGLIKATHRWEHRKNTKFSTYATWLIRQKMTRALSQQGNTIRRPGYLEDRIRKIIKTKSKLRVDLEKEPSPEEIAKDMNLPLKKLEKTFEKSAIKSISLSTPINGGDSELWMLIEDKKAENPLKNAAKQELNNKVEETLVILTPKERNIIELRFGIGENTYEHTLNELGVKLHFSRERIRQIEESALRKLRYPLKCFLQDSI